MTGETNPALAWALTTREVPAARVVAGESMTPATLTELRAVLAVFADAPIATLEIHAVPDDLDRSRGMHLDRTSPLAVHLADIAAQAAENGGIGEALYRMVVPAKFAAEVGGGMIKPIASNAVPGGLHSASSGKHGIAGRDTFMRAAGADVVTLAAPLLMMAVAAGVSLCAARQRHEALGKINELLEKARRDVLNKEVDILNSCRGPIEKATAVLLDRGGVGVHLGLDSAAKDIDTAVEAAWRNLTTWRKGLEALGDRAVEIGALRRKFDGIDREDGEFGFQLQLAELAIALKKRLIVVQAVAQAQADPGNTLMNFVRVLKKDQEGVIGLESGITDLKRSLGNLRLDRSHGIRDGLGLTAGDVDHLLRTIYRLRELAESLDPDDGQSDVVVDLVPNRDGSVVVFPALQA